MRNQLQRKARILAVKARGKFNLSTSQPIDIFKLLLIADIICLKEPLPDDISGIYTNADGVKLTIINTNKTVGHQAFTAAHELYHAEFDDHMVDQVCQAGNFDYGNEVEIMADLFADSFLMPEEGIRFYLDEKLGDRMTIELSDVIYLEQIFGTSHVSMLRRLNTLKLISSIQMTKLSPNIRRNALLLGYDDTIYYPSRESKLISDYAAIVQKAFEMGKISDSRYSELMADVQLPDIDGVVEYAD